MADTGRPADPGGPLVVVLSGPGGAGKGTIARILAAADDSISLSVSWTSRDRRSDDADDAYVFVDRAAFEARRDEGGFIEWNEFLGCYYGTPVPGADDGQVLLLEIDVAGGRQVLQSDPGALCLFVDAPDDDELRRRLVDRGDGTERADARIIEAMRERAEAVDLGYTIVLNADLDRAVREVAALIAARLATKSPR
ncbi:MAG TPA: hypothetical protein QGF43_04590 [Acidimicrobiales bacterium]|nr:hypothetical protein [Acidimicrobiales bacterium]MDP6281716.1 hypothetical protein [Acidimicrobiales bacterium]MDP7118029.1 hypothetical protein [Acidimicrobiales bacterium]MDP7411441.1 hypothetical protein [Acidimicrobiales bacterium]MEE1571255.1 hypothetical protein [Acidimicrobiales bacterium]